MKKKSFTKQVFWFSLINYFGIVVGIVSTLFIYPKNPEFLGIIRTIESYSQVIFPIILLGAAQGLIHFYPTLSTENKNNLFLYSLYSVFVNSIIVIAVVFLVYIFLEFEFIQYLWFALLLGVFIAFNEVFKRQLVNLQRIAYPSLFEKIIPKIFLPLSFILIATNLIKEKQGAWLFTISYIIVLFLTGFYTLKKYRPKWNFNFKNIFKFLSKKEYFKYSRYSFAGSLGSLFAFRIDTIMLGFFGYTMREIGIYNLGVSLASMLIIPATGIFAINSPAISELVKSLKIKELHTKYKENAKLLFALGATLYSCIFIGINDLFALLPSKENLLESVPFMCVLGLGMIINMGTGFNSEIISFSKYYRFNVIAILTMILLTIGLNLLFLLVFNMEMLGVAYATLISISIFNFSKTFYIWQKFKISPFDKKYGQLFLVILSVGIFVNLLPDHSSHFWNLILKSGGSIALNSILIYKMKFIYHFRIRQT